VLANRTSDVKVLGSDFLVSNRRHLLVLAQVLYSTHTHILLTHSPCTLRMGILRLQYYGMLLFIIIQFGLSTRPDRRKLLDSNVLSPYCTSPRVLACRTDLNLIQTLSTRGNGDQRIKCDLKDRSSSAALHCYRLQSTDFQFTNDEIEPRAV
jgi:hypothetical protein